MALVGKRSRNLLPEPSARSVGIPLHTVAPLALFLALLLSGVPAGAQQQPDRQRVDFAFSHEQAKLGVQAEVGSLDDQSRVGGFVQPRFDLGTESFGRVFGVASMTGAVSEAGEASATSLRNTGEGDIDQLYAGWSSGRLLGVGQDALSLSVGRQGARVEDGAVRWGAVPDSCDARCRLDSSPPHLQSTVLSFNTEPARSDFFYAKGDQAEGSSELVGADGRLTHGEASLGGRYVRMIDPGNRLGLGVVGGYGRVEVGYSPEGRLPWSPRLLYGYSFLSGQPSTGNDEDGRANLPLFEVSQGWNAGFPASAGGNPLHFDSGRAHDIGLKLKPADTLSIGALYVLCQCTRLAHAFDLVADWTPTERVKMSLGGGVAMAGLSDPQPVSSDSLAAALQASLNISF